MKTIFPNLDKAKHLVLVALFFLLPFMNFAQVTFNHSTPICEGASNSGEVTVAGLGAIVDGTYDVTWNGNVVATIIIASGNGVSTVFNTSGFASGSHTFIISGESSVALVVNAKPDAPVASNVNVVYDNTIHTGSTTSVLNVDIDWYDAAIAGSATSAPSRTIVGSNSAFAEARNTSTGCLSASRTEVSVTITTKELTISGLTGDNKVYNGLTNATASGTPAYVGLGIGEVFGVTGTPTYTFASAAVANGITINTTGFTAPSANYTVAQPTLSGNITAKELTISGLTGVD
ncbi:MAG: YDG domain-containing protein, partial [Bacteroidota bacterium]|nr:YDG domain-containing protein [Bacteroidota bacterium]